MKTQAKPIAEITEEAIRVLSRELGMADTLRFFEQFYTGRGDYVKERDALFAGFTLDDLLAEIRRNPPRQQFGTGDYTRDRHTLLGNPSPEEFFAEVRRREALRSNADGA